MTSLKDYSRKTDEYSSVVVRPLYGSEWDSAMNLVWDTFILYEAPDYSKEGIEHFRSFVRDPMLKKMFLKGEYIAYGAFHGPDIVGFLGVRNKNHVSLLFVDRDYHRKGIATDLLFEYFRYAKSEMSVSEVTVNAAPYALGFYHRIGFWDLCEKKEESGITFTPMVIRL